MEVSRESLFIGALLPLVIIIFVIGLGVVLLYQNFQKNLIAQQLKQETLKNIYQNSLLLSSIEAQEEERKHIAQDLHDELGAVLSIMRMNMVMLEEQSLRAGDDSLKVLQNMRQWSETALTSVRSISHRLMPPQLETFGLVKTLESVAAQINSTGAIEIQLLTTPASCEIPWSTTLGLYRIIMELINNTIKHAAASRITIDLHMQQHITCRYTDNGIGLTDGAIPAKGLGYKNIQGRITALGGLVETGNAAGGGFYAHIRIPGAPSQRSAEQKADQSG